MAFTKLTENVRKVSELPDTPSDIYTATELKAIFDEAGVILKGFLNDTLIEELDGEGAAANIGISPIEGLGTADTVQAALAALYTAIVNSQAGVVTDGSITTAKLANLAVTAAKLGELAVVTSKIADLAVTAAKIANGAVENAKLADGAVTQEKIAANAVTAAKLGTNAVTSDKLADLAVTTEKLGDGAVTGQKIANATIGNAKLNLSGDFAPNGPIKLRAADLYNSVSALPAPTGSYRMYFVKA